METDVILYIIFIKTTLLKLRKFVKDFLLLNIEISCIYCFLIAFPSFIIYAFLIAIIISDTQYWLSISCIKYLTVTQLYFDFSQKKLILSLHCYFCVMYILNFISSPFSEIINYTRVKPQIDHLHVKNPLNIPKTILSRSISRKLMLYAYRGGAFTVQNLSQNTGNNQIALLGHVQKQFKWTFLDLPVI